LPGLALVVLALSAALLATWLTTARAAPAGAAAFPESVLVVPGEDSVRTTSGTDHRGLTGTPRDHLAEARAAFTPENRAYQRIRVRLALFSPLLGILVSAGLLFTGDAQRLRDFALARGRNRWSRVLIYWSVYSLAVFVILLPLAWYGGYHVEKQFGFATQTLGGWFADLLKGLAFQVVAVGVVPVLALASFVVESSPRRWWIWLAACSLPLILAIVVLQPLVFDPLFNKFTPLKDTQLRDEILALGARAHVPAKNVYEVDMSTKTTKINAYVSGFGASQRIVLWDTTLEKLKKDEILFIMGHEMGHYVLAHIWKGVLLIAVGSFLALWCVARLSNAALRVFGPRWGITSLGDLAAIPLLFAVLSLVNWVGEPFANVFSRAFEHEADVYALEITRDNDAGARSFLELARGNRSNPEPAGWVKLLLYTHPPLGERIRFAEEYRPWERGEPNSVYRGE
jgi:Zn-dependent protease with chaperone function